MSDLIDRQSVKEWLERWEGYLDKDMIARMQLKVDDIPTHPTPSNTLGALDCVERQAAMKIRFSSGFDHDGILFVPYRDVEEHLKKLPSVQPKIIRCKDCKWFNKLGCAIWIKDGSDKPTENDYCSFAEKRGDSDD